ncbi:macro domain-containing protein [Nocardia rhizosphaerae]|uniref:Macro domain-containing protein n=1 Tax=Nocardia rhizosphaerae TaxID=1691571 RepID=A0ABV8L8U7_9NOCA
MIREESGNLLDADTEALVNAVNTVGVMGKGIALQFKQAYPDMFREYARAARMGDLHVGRMFVWETGAARGPRLIVNFPTKRHWRSASRLDDVSAGLPVLAETIERYRIQSIAIPALGCGHGGLTWEEVGPLIKKALEPLAAKVEIRLYPPVPSK